MDMDFLLGACFILKGTAGGPFIFRTSVNHAIDGIEDWWASGLLIELCSSLCPSRLSGDSQTPLVQV